MDKGEYLMALRRKLENGRVPFSGSLELTKRCNLRCVHCYNGSLSDRTGRDELDTGRLLHLIDEMAEAGCLYLLITGGEPLLRADFEEVYRHAKLKGMLVTVFTNGTMVDEGVLTLFRELPPSLVEISLYGATEATYEGITGVKGSFKRCLRGIDALIANRTRLAMKTVLMTHNVHEVYEIKKVAEGLGVKFRFDASLFPCFDGDRSPVGLRVPPEEAVRIDFSDPGRARGWREYFKKQSVEPSDALYRCGAGQTSFHVDAEGYLRPCLMNRTLKYDLSTGDFATGWREAMPEVRRRMAPEGSACGTCEKKPLCEFCPPFFELENGSEDAPSSYLCAVGEERYKAIMQVAQ